MKIENLTKTNFIAESKAVEIEEILQKEITTVITMKNGFEKELFRIMPGDSSPKSIYATLKPFTYSNKYLFNRKTNILTVTGRNKWQRSFSEKKYQLEIIGYKLATTHLPEGFIYGNPQEIA